MRKTISMFLFLVICATAVISVALFFVYKNCGALSWSYDPGDSIGIEAGKTQTQPNDSDNIFGNGNATTPTGGNDATEPSGGNDATEPTGGNDSTEPTGGNDPTEPTGGNDETPGPDDKEPDKQPDNSENPDDDDDKDTDDNKDSVKYTEVNETVYATADVNVRSGPGSRYTKLGQMEKGEKVTRTGIGDNGWSRVEYKGEVGYVYSDYLTTTKPSTDDGGAGSGNTSSGGTSSDDEIIYTYPDGSTGTEPREGATYVDFRGVTVTYHEGDYDSSWTEEEREAADNGIYYCSCCGKVAGDGTDGTCRRWLTGGEHVCPHCGETVPGGTCHTCVKD